MISEHERVFSRSSYELPKPILGLDGKPIIIKFNWKPGAKPMRCRPPSDRPGSPRYKILLGVQKNLTHMGLIRMLKDGKSSNRPHLVAKWATDADRSVEGATPKTLRFTADLVATNTQIQLLSAINGDVARELQRAA